MDEGGEVLLARAYAPYGETPMEITQSPNAAITPYGFTGEWTDATGLVYLRARDYNPNKVWTLSPAREFMASP